MGGRSFHVMDSVQEVFVMDHTRPPLVEESVWNSRSRTSEMVRLAIPETSNFTNDCLIGSASTQNPMSEPKLPSGCDWSTYVSATGVNFRVWGSPSTEAGAAGRFEPATAGETPTSPTEPTSSTPTAIRCLRIR